MTAEVFQGNILEHWSVAADWQDPRVDLDEALEEVGWVATTDRTPYGNTVDLVNTLPDGVSDQTIIQICFRRVRGMGPTVTPKALERARERGDI